MNTIITATEYNELECINKCFYQPNNTIEHYFGPINGGYTEVVDYINIAYKKKRDADAIDEIMQSNIITNREFEKLPEEYRMHFIPYRTERVDYRPNGGIINIVIQYINQDNQGNQDIMS